MKLSFLMKSIPLALCFPSLLIFLPLFCFSLFGFRSQEWSSFFSCQWESVSFSSKTNIICQVKQILVHPVSVLQITFRVLVQKTSLHWKTKFEESQCTTTTNILSFFTNSRINIDYIFHLPFEAPLDPETKLSGTDERSDHGLHQVLDSWNTDLSSVPRGHAKTEKYSCHKRHYAVDLVSGTPFYLRLLQSQKLDVLHTRTSCVLGTYQWSNVICLPQRYSHGRCTLVWLAYGLGSSLHNRDHLLLKTNDVMIPKRFHRQLPCPKQFHKWQMKLDVLDHSICLLVIFHVVHQFVECFHRHLTSQGNTNQLRYWNKVSTHGSPGIDEKVATLLLHNWEVHGQGFLIICRNKSLFSGTWVGYSSGLFSL